MEMTTRGIWTMVHGMGFGALYLLACSFAIVELYRRYKPQFFAAEFPLRTKNFLGRWLSWMAVVAWITVLTGAYVIYPWYRAVPPVGHGRAQRVSTGTAQVQSEHHRLACNRHGVEGAHCLDGANFDHHGSGGFLSVPALSHELSATAHGGVDICFRIVRERRDCGILRRGVEQARSG